MAAILDFIIEESCNCKKIVFRETTGAYNADTNTGGWGTPNEETSAATSVLLKVTFPEGTTAYEVDLSATFPVTNTFTELELTYAEVTAGTEEGTSFPDGLYEIEYEVITANETYSRIKKMYFWCGLRCCVDKLFANINYENCGCDHPQMSEALTALGLLRGLAYHASCGNYDEADLIKTKLETLCSNSKYCTDC